MFIVCIIYSKTINFVLKQSEILLLFTYIFQNFNNLMSICNKGEISSILIYIVSEG